jgi:hypothetical protein
MANDLPDRNQTGIRAKWLEKVEPGAHSLPYDASNRAASGRSGLPAWLPLTGTCSEEPLYAYNRGRHPLTFSLNSYIRILTCCSWNVGASEPVSSGAKAPACPVCYRSRAEAEGVATLAIVSPGPPGTVPRRNPGVLHNSGACGRAAIRKRRCPGMENGARGEAPSKAVRPPTRPGEHGRVAEALVRAARLSAYT